jgi:hypothetical protein
MFQTAICADRFSWHAGILKLGQPADIMTDYFLEMGFLPSDYNIDLKIGS